MAHIFSRFGRLGKHKLTIFISVFSLLFFTLLVFDIYPALRGPNDVNLTSQWPYYFVNTFHKIWAPLIPFLLLICIYLWGKKQKIIIFKKEFLFLFLTVVCVFIFQISLVYFSRFGITVLFRRMVNPGINGYFSSSLKIGNTLLFIDNFEKYFPYLDQHGRGHPPGGVVVLRNITYFFEGNQQITDFVLTKIRTPKNEALLLWKKLTPAQQVSSVVSAFLLHLLASFSIIPLYYLVKKLKNHQTAIDSVMLLSLTPSFAFFALLFDPIYALLSTTVGLLLVSSLGKNKSHLLFLAGTLMVFSLFFSISILPAMMVMVIAIFLWNFKFLKDELLKRWLSFFAGLITSILFFYSIGYDFFNTLSLVVKYQAPREYLDWVFYNPYDFFVYLGIPTSLLFIYLTISTFKNKSKKTDLKKIILWSFWFVFLLLIITGISRGEVGRIWLPLMIIPLMLLPLFENFKKQTNLLIIFLLLFIQIIIMEEFWVPIW